MTNEEAKEFFEKVKGKKIRWSSWHLDIYFIPLRHITWSYIEGEKCIKDHETVNVDYSMMEGFLPASDGNKWEFYEKETEMKIKAPNSIPSIPINIELKKCTCNSTDLFNYGCKCGGI